MLDGLFTHYASKIFIGAVLTFALSRFVACGKKKRRKEKPDPAAIFGPIRGMFVCYQCDTVFNTSQCPGCHEEGSIPLIHLTGSILEDERVAAVANRMNGRPGRKAASFNNELMVQPGQAPVPEAPNGDASEVPVRIVFSPQRGRELS